MAYYTGKTWRDRQVEHAGRRILTNVSTSETMTVDVERAEGAVSVAGNPFNAAQMNDLESRVTAGFTTTETEVNKNPYLSITQNQTQINKKYINPSASHPCSVNSHRL